MEEIGGSDTRHREGRELWRWQSHQSNTDNGDGNGDSDRWQALGSWWCCIRWRWKWDFAVENYSVMGEYIFCN
jgi:hypothetical protein